MKDSQTYQALWVTENPPGKFNRQVVEQSLENLPPGEVLVQVHYSSLNYKDALSATGNRGVTRKYPHVPGIDMAGLVEVSDSPRYAPGQEVLITAGEMGVNTPGGFAQYVRVPADWLVPLPKGLSLRESMALGTAGFTAALSVNKLEKAGLTPEQGEILVTGATGGVGSIATAILAREGFQVITATGKVEHHQMLRALGAQQVIAREEVLDNSSRPLLHARWAGVVDTVGGSYLASAIRATQPGGVVTTCGNAAGADLMLTVFPFILRGVSLLGIDALLPGYAERVRLWEMLAGKWKLPMLDELVREVTLDQLEVEIQRILQGGQTGRVIVNLQA